MYSCWDVFLWCGLWKRSCTPPSPLYSSSHLTGTGSPSSQLLILAVCYLYLTCRSHFHRRHSGRLLLSQTPSQEDRFDDLREILDDSLPGPVSADNLSPLEQDSILDI
ncbi:uncharacterized protein LOC124361403 [Homalodisca vitripennis]|uniref:uncharacterized protein LOC124361403 n=1 Tax=Homalodisca vitripennis TaxID=197043 RepID=UPI001EEAA289|nr:uncharacterized protein LOC124361403 [Homalodisca vitripennis]